MALNWRGRGIKEVTLDANKVVQEVKHGKAAFFKVAQLFLTHCRFKVLLSWPR